MDVSRTIKCSSVWGALMLRLMLEEHGVQVRVPEEESRNTAGADPGVQAVVLSMVASGAYDGIKAAVTQLGHEFPRSGTVTIEGEDHDEGAHHDEGAGHDAGEDTDQFAAIRTPDLLPGGQDGQEDHEEGSGQDDPSREAGASPQ